MYKHIRNLRSDQRVSRTNSSRRLSLKTGSLALLVLVCLLSVLVGAWATSSHKAHAANPDHLHTLMNSLANGGVAEWNQWRQQNPNITPDLSGADLSQLNLSGVDLNRANLSRADLSTADLSGANLNGANFLNADLKGVNAKGADFTGANLSETDLHNADLRGTGISKSNVEKIGATTTGAIFG